MKRVTIVVALLIAGLAIAQPGKSHKDKDKKEQKGGKPDHHNKKDHDDHKDKHNGDRDIKIDIRFGDDKDHHDKDHHDKKDHHAKNKHNKKPDGGGHPEGHPGKGKGHAYGLNKGGLSGREFGHTRAGKIKGEDIRTDDDARRIITEIRLENVNILNEIGSKLKRAKDTLEGMKVKGEISDQEYEIKSKRVEEMGEREVGIRTKIDRRF